MQEYMQKVCFLYIGKFTNFAYRRPLSKRDFTLFCRIYDICVRSLRQTLLFSEVRHSLLVAKGPTKFGTVRQTAKEYRSTIESGGRRRIRQQCQRVDAETTTWGVRTGCWKNRHMRRPPMDFLIWSPMAAAVAAAAVDGSNMHPNQHTTFWQDVTPAPVPTLWVKLTFFGQWAMTGRLTMAGGQRRRRRWAAAADDGGRGQWGGGFMRCKGEEDIWMSFP